MKRTFTPKFLALALTCFSFAATLAVAPVAHAEEDPNGWVGGLLGLTVPNADETSSRSMWGLTAGAKLGSEWGLGAYYLTSHKDEGTPIGDFNFDLYGVQCGYHFEGEARGVFLAGRVGTSKLTSGVTDISPMNLGAVAGYDFFLGDHFSLGGEASFMNISGSDGIESFTILSFMGAAKFWF